MDTVDSPGVIIDCSQVGNLNTVNPQDDCAGRVITPENEMGVVVSHDDRVRVEVEASAVARLSEGGFVGEVDGDGVIDQRLQAKSAVQGSETAYAEITQVGFAS